MEEGGKERKNREEREGEGKWGDGGGKWDEVECFNNNNKNKCKAILMGGLGRKNYKKFMYHSSVLSKITLRKVNGKIYLIFQVFLALIT